MPWRHGAGSKEKWERITPGDWQSAGRPDQVVVDKPVAGIGPAAKNREAMVTAVRKAIDGDSRVFGLKDGSPMLVDADALAEHLPLDRAPFVPFIRETVDDPFEIWVSFERHTASGKVELRKRLVKVVKDTDKYIVVVAQMRNGMLEAWTMIPSSRLNQINRSRVGILLYGRPTADSTAIAGTGLAGLSPNLDPSVGGE